MSQYDKNKKVAHEMQLSLFQLSVIKMEQNSKQCDSSRGVKKQGRLQHCLLLCFVLLTEAQNKLLAVKWVTDVVSMFDFLCDL